MRSHTILPLVDLIFLAFGGALCCMTQMEVIRALPVEVTQVGRGSSVVKHGKFAILTLTHDGMNIDGTPIRREDLVDKATGKQLVLRVEGDLPTRETIQVIGDLVRAGAEVSLEVKEQKE
jgi:hypothetical protein